MRFSGIRLASSDMVRCAAFQPPAPRLRPCARDRGRISLSRFRPICLAFVFSLRHLPCFCVAKLVVLMFFLRGFVPPRIKSNTANGIDSRACFRNVGPLVIGSLHSGIFGAQLIRFRASLGMLSGASVLLRAPIYDFLSRRLW